MTASDKKRNSHYQLQAILSRRDHSVAEARRKLTTKGFSVEQVAETIQWGKDHRLLNDHNFSERFITTTLQVKAVGRRWLKAKLLHRGVERSIIDETLGRLLSPEQEREQADQAVTRWRQRYPQHIADTARVQRWLLARGFSTDIINSVSRRDDAD